MPVLAPLDIVNRACARIGCDPLQTLSEDTIGGRSAELVYGSVIEFMLGVYRFSWSREFRQLSQLEGASPLSAYALAYQLPPDRLGPPLRIVDDPTVDRGFSAFLLTGDLVLSDVAPLYAEICILPPPARWSTAFREAATLLVAGELALAIAHDKDLRERLRADALGTPSAQPRGGAMAAAMAADAQATPPRRLQANNPLLDAWRS